MEGVCLLQTTPTCGTASAHLCLALVREERLVVSGDAGPLWVDENLSRSQRYERPVDVHGVLVLRAMRGLMMRDHQGDLVFQRWPRACEPVDQYNLARVGLCVHDATTPLTFCVVDVQGGAIADLKTMFCKLSLSTGTYKTPKDERKHQSRWGIATGAKFENQGLFFQRR